MKFNIKTIKSSMQSIGNSLVVAGLIATLFKGTIPPYVVEISIISGACLIIYTALERDK